jgi:hypothetical protein
MLRRRGGTDAAPPSVSVCRGTARRVAATKRRKREAQPGISISPTGIDTRRYAMTPLCIDVADGAPPKITFACPLVLRQSCAPPRSRELPIG